MADRLEVFPVTVPPGTPQAAPLVSALHFTPGYLVRWEVVIPDGVAGLAGFQVAYSGQPVIPDTQGGWVIGNGEKVGDDLAVSYVGDQWTLVAYNTDIFPHTFYVRLGVNELSHSTVAAAPGLTVPAVLDSGVGAVDLGPPGASGVFDTDTLPPTPIAALDILADPDLGGDVTADSMGGTSP